MLYHYISNETLVLEQLAALISDDTKLKLSEEAIVNIRRCHKFLDEKVRQSTERLQELLDSSFFNPDGQLKEGEVSIMQQDLLRHYACGIGERLPSRIVKIMLFLKIQSFSYGFSGVRRELVQRLIDFYNHGVYPVVYSKEIPDERIALAHLSLPIFGEGEVCINHKVYSASELEARYGWKPLPLAIREADALLNGTQLTTAYSAYNLIRVLGLLPIADFVASVSTQVFGGNLSAFSEQMQIAHPHKGQVETATALRRWLKNGGLDTVPTDLNAMPEAFSSIPQIHGAVKDTMTHVRKLIKTEMNSATDNPLLFPESEDIILGGNSHTLPLSLGMDFLCIALTSLGNIAERRVFYLLSNTDKNTDDELDYSIFQRIIESILNENRRLSTPASIESPILFEKAIDIKGMGGSAAVKCHQVIRNIEKILAIELILAASIWKKKNIAYHSDPLNEYFAFMETSGEKRTLKREIEQTIQFFTTYGLSDRS